MTFAKLLPLAFVMIAGPQILSAIFLATTERWKANSAAFVAGAAVSVTTVTSIGYLLSTGASDEGTSNTTLDVIIIVLLVAAAIHKYVTRKQSKPPAWMGKLETAQPKGAFKLGFLLLGIFPSDILTSIAVGGYASSHGEAWWQIFGFVGLTLLFVALPALTVVALGKKAEAFLPKVRDWMNANSWVVSEIVLALFIALTASSLSS
jgi:Sap, sulfolipid-1-addressing protein